MIGRLLRFLRGPTQPALGCLSNEELDSLFEADEAREEPGEGLDDAGEDGGVGEPGASR